MPLLMTIRHADHEGDIPVAIPAPEQGSDPETVARMERMDERRAWAIALLGKRYVFHKMNRIERAQVAQFQLEQTK